MKTTAQSAAAYGESDDALDSWDDLTVTVEADGDAGVTLDASPADLDSDWYPMGLPGVGIRLTRAEARDLAVSLLVATGALRDVRRALIDAADDMRYKLNLPDYDPEDAVEMRAQLDRWESLSLAIGQLA